jgi:hypothetical protein
VKDSCNEKYKSLKKEINEDIRRWKDILCSWIGRINMIKITTLPKVVNYLFTTVSIKIPMTFLA